MAQVGLVQHTSCESLFSVAPEGVGTMALVQVSAVVATRLIAPERMARLALESRPMITHAVAVGQAICVAVTPAGTVSLAKVTLVLGVVAP